MWDFFFSLWYCRNGELHGGSPEEQRRKVLSTTRERVQRVYNASLGQIPAYYARYLHHNPVDDILRWTQAHLDAYLRTAEVLVPQNVEPG